MTYRSHPVDWGLAPEKHTDKINAARERVRQRVESGIAPAAIDAALADGQITADGTILLPSSAMSRPIRLGKKKQQKGPNVSDMVQKGEVSWVNVADELGVEVFPEAMPSFGRDVRYPASDSDVKFVTGRYEEGLPIEGPLTLGALAYIGMRAESEFETASFAVVVDVERDRQRRQKAGRRARPSEVRKEGRKGKNG